MNNKPRLGVFKFASCDGCQLSLLSLEDELLELSNHIDIAYFLEATSRIEPGPYDLVLVEGSITTADDAKRIQQIRADARYLVTIGACATSGGIQSLRNWQNVDEMLSVVYARPEYIRTLATSTAIADHVHVDFELRGCPVNKYQLLEVIRATLADREPQTPRHSVCLDCKRQGTVCIMVTEQRPCLGPITQAGCGAICPAFNRPCYGCFGPAAQSNLLAWGEELRHQGESTDAIVSMLRSFNGYAPELRNEYTHLSEKLAAKGDGDKDEP